MILVERMPDQAGAGTTGAARHANLYTLSPYALSAKWQPIVISMDVALRLKIPSIHHQRHPAWSAVGVKTACTSLVIKF
jgi:hypothetical protein